MTSKHMNPDTGTESSVVPSMPQAAGEKTAPHRPSEAQLVSFGDRITYTFAYGKEVGSVHFDRARGEIFYKGHNIRNMEIEDWQMQVLEELRRILTASEDGQKFATPYAKTLDKIIWEKKSHPR